MCNHLARGFHLGQSRACPEECLQDLSKHLRCASDLAVETEPSPLFPDVVSLLKYRPYVSCSSIHVGSSDAEIKAKM